MSKPLGFRENAHSDGIWCCAWGNENTFITGSVDETMKIWSVTQKDKQDPDSPVDIKEKSILAGHTLGVISVAVNDKIIASSSLDCHLRFWDHEGTCKQVIGCGAAENWGIGLSGNLVATGSQGGNINIWELQNYQKVQTLETKKKAMILSVAFSPNGRYLCCGGMDGTVCVFDAQSMKLLNAIEGHTKGIRSLSFTPDSTTLITASDDTQIKLFDLRDDSKRGNSIFSFTGHSSWVLSVASTQNGKQIISSSSDGSVKFWDIAKRECVQTFKDHSDQVWGVSVNPTGTLVGSVGDDKSFYIRSGIEK